MGPKTVYAEMTDVSARLQPSTRPRCLTVRQGEDLALEVSVEGLTMYLTPLQVRVLRDVLSEHLQEVRPR